MLNSKQTYEALKEILSNRNLDAIKYAKRLEMGITGPVMKPPIQANYKNKSN